MAINSGLRFLANRINNGETGLSPEHITYFNNIEIGGTLKVLSTEDVEHLKGISDTDRNRWNRFYERTSKVEELEKLGIEVAENALLASITFREPEMLLATAFQG